ncbi:hypothetical protein [Hydrogenophaga sp. RWCD_12]|uniref:hypothetical protein n=1 Tax=Hydrogenophaga sp. RWCD_12 TaxID=3391190 RepID=UPI00398503C5
MRRGGLSALRQADTLLAWVLLGWLGQRLGWSLASGVLPVVLWWTVRCASASASANVTGRGPVPLVLLLGAWTLLGSLPALPSGQAALVALLAASALWGGWSASLAARSGDTTPTLPGQAMGLMMGSLWLSGQWCLGPGWTDAQAVGLHLGLMAGLPLLWTALRLGRRQPLQVSVLQQTVLLAAGALLMAWPDAAGWRLAGMVLAALAWSLEVPPEPADRPLCSRVPAGLGPAVLLSTGLMAPTLGPLALQVAWGLIGLLALAWVARAGFQRGAAVPPLRRWRDAA